LHHDAHLSALHDSLIFTEPHIFRNFTIVYFDRAALSFGASRWFVSTEPFYRSAFHDILFLPSRIIFRNFTTVYFFARTPFAQIFLTPLFSCATLRARSFKFMPRWSRQEQHGVRKDSLNLTRFYARLQAQFLIFSRLCFLLFHALYSSAVFIFSESLSPLALHDILFLARYFIFVLSRYFLSCGF